jgi:hypothetical protein
MVVVGEPKEVLVLDKARARSNSGKSEYLPDMRI